MTKEQFEAIVALISSQQMAITHLSIKVAEFTNSDKSDLAESFRVLGDSLFKKNNGALAGVILSQIANGIETGGAVTKEDIQSEINGLLH